MHTTMKTRLTPGLASALLFLPAVAGLAAAPPPTVRAAPAAAAPALDKVATSKIKDMTAVLRVVKVDFEALGKIDKGITTQFRTLKRADVAYQYPNKIRLSNSVAVLIFNQDMRSVKIPLVRLNKTESVAGQPGQKQSLMALGIFAPDYLEVNYEPTFQRTEGGRHVYKLTQRNTDNRSHEILWVNPKTHIIEKRVSYNGDNVKRMETRYLDARQVRPGIWLPTRIEVYNQFGELGGVQSLEDPKVNLGVDASLFAIK